MSVGLHIGPRPLRIGLRISDPGGVDPFAGITKDATSGIYTPANSSEWDTLIAAAGLTGSIAAPDALHGFQDASGSITDQIGTFPLTTTGAPSYQQSESGWSRKAVVTTDGGGMIFSTTNAGLPDPAAASYLGLVIMKPGIPASSRQLLRFGSSAQASLQITTNGKLRAATNSGVSFTDSTNAVSGSVHMLALRYNFTASTVTGFTEAEKLSVTWHAASGKLLQVTNSAPADTLYAAHWFGAHAEVSDAVLRALEQAMRIAVAW